MDFSDLIYKTIDKKQAKTLYPPYLLLQAEIAEYYTDLIYDSDSLSITHLYHLIGYPTSICKGFYDCLFEIRESMSVSIPNTEHFKTLLREYSEKNEENDEGESEDTYSSLLKSSGRKIIDYCRKNIDIHDDQVTELNKDPLSYILPHSFEKAIERKVSKPKNLIFELEHFITSLEYIRNKEMQNKLTPLVWEIHNIIEKNGPLPADFMVKIAHLVNIVFKNFSDNKKKCELKEIIDGISQPLFVLNRDTYRFSLNKEEEREAAPVLVRRMIEEIEVYLKTPAIHLPKLARDLFDALLGIERSRYYMEKKSGFLLGLFWWSASVIIGGGSLFVFFGTLNLFVKWSIFIIGISVAGLIFILSTIYLLEFLIKYSIKQYWHVRTYSLFESINVEIWRGGIYKAPEILSYRLKKLEKFGFYPSLHLYALLNHMATDLKEVKFEED